MSTNSTHSDISINPVQEREKIFTFLQDTFAAQKMHKAVIGLSAGIDSTTSFYLLKKVLAPEDIIVAHLYYFQSQFNQLKTILEQAQIPQKNIHLISIKEAVDTVSKMLVSETDEEKTLRVGNISARIRMIVLFDLAKKYNALVCGTENKSENLLGYFTRFGDQASDIEPIEHLYKTQVFMLAKSLGIPEEIISVKPSAGLWPNQTDEGQFGFTYEEADQVLFLALEKKVPVGELVKRGFKNADKILAWRQKNLFKNNTPYKISF